MSQAAGSTCTEAWSQENQAGQSGDGHRLGCPGPNSFSWCLSIHVPPLGTPKPPTDPKIKRWEKQFHQPVLKFKLQLIPTRIQGFLGQAEVRPTPHKCGFAAPKGVFTAVSYSFSGQPCDAGMISLFPALG